MRNPFRSTPYPSRVHARGAFTLVEMLLVLAVISTVAAVAVPRFINANQRYHARAAAHHLAAEIELARDAARQRSRTITLHLDLDANTITIDNLDHPDHPGTVYTRRLDDPPYDVRLIQVDFDSQVSLSFDAFAQPSASGTITLASSNTRKRITIRQSDGKVQIHRD